MLQLLADENFNNNIVRGVLRRRAAVDIVRIQDVGLSHAEQGRVLLTHDVSTITKYAYERIEAGQGMPGVFEVSRTAPIGQVIADILLLAEASLKGEWEGQIIYLPLR